MKIILLDKIQRLGEIGDIVEVNSGYARNFLIPQKKIIHTPEFSSFFCKKSGLGVQIFQKTTTKM